jgi:heme-degrading monooxygenase HmoA
MYLRFIRLVVREGAEPEFQAFYRGRVIPALQSVPGCVFAGLLIPWRSEEHRSITLWRSGEDARAYEQSGLYHQLLAESLPYLSSRTVWRARLGDDPLVTMDPALAAAGGREIPPEGYELGPEGGDLGDLQRRAFVRIVALRAAPGKRDELAALYRDVVLPALQETTGCLGAHFAEGARDPDEVLSITVWDREESAPRYEMSGEFERLRRRLSPALAATALWQVTLGEGRGDRQRADVASYHLVHGRRLAGDDDPK